MQFSQFPKYLPGSDIAYHQASDWSGEREALKALGGRLLSMDEANSLPIGDAVRIGTMPLNNGAMLYKPQAAAAMQVCNLPYKALQQETMIAEIAGESYAQIVEKYVAKKFARDKYLCVLDPTRCCVIHHENFTYKLLEAIQNPHQTIPLALIDQTAMRVVLFELDMPIQRVCDAEPSKLGGRLFKIWNRDFERFMANSSQALNMDQHAFQAVAALKAPRA